MTRATAWLPAGLLAALAAGLVKAAAELHAGMATFESAGVTDKETR